MATLLLESRPMICNDDDKNICTFHGRLSAEQTTSAQLCNCVFFLSMNSDMIEDSLPSPEAEHEDTN